ncbi:MAG: hypothetical protein IJA14_02620 [Alphaproteobacteria bacterium]|nr:hypothetical protein [Alphaproteobacteria bacterium]
MILIEAAVTLPVVMYIMLFCLELVKIHLLQISIDKICAECVYHLCSERTVGSFNSIFAKYRPSYIPVGYVRYYCRVYSSLENMTSNTPYGGERIAFPNDGTDDGKPNANAIKNNFGTGGHTPLIILKKYGGVGASDIGQDTRVSQLQNGLTKGYVFVLTVTAKHQFSSAFVEKLFNGGSNTTVPGYYILWSRGVGIVN